MLAQRLRDLDNRVLGMDKRMAEMRTEAGWRKNAARWRLLAVIAALMIGTAYVRGLFADDGSFAGLTLFGGVMAFQAGMLKAEDDRLNKRGQMSKLRPPGL
jgi:hypothetical protein